MANWNTRLRWIHLIFGMMISVYFARITFSGDINAWDDQPWVTMAMGNAVMAIVFWSGIIKWQLPGSRSGTESGRKPRLKRLRPVNLLLDDSGVGQAPLVQVDHVALGVDEGHASGLRDVHFSSGLVPS